MRSDYPGGTAAIRDERDHKVEVIIGALLRIGVLLAAAVVIVGAALLLWHHGRSVAQFSQFRGEESLLRSVGAIARGVIAGDSRAIVQAGLVLLIATPVARVALTLGAFILQRDRLYVLVTSIVLALLLYGLIWGKA